MRTTLGGWSQEMSTLLRPTEGNVLPPLRKPQGPGRNYSVVHPTFYTSLPSQTVLLRTAPLHAVL